MKVIPPQNVPNFHGIASKDLYAFLFEFNILCWGYDYTTDPKKVKLFPSTMKGEMLLWFMGSGGGNINSWDQMKQTFLTKYQDYFQSQELEIEIFKTTFKEYENLEEYIERFQYNLQISP